MLIWGQKSPPSSPGPGGLQFGQSRVSLWGHAGTEEHCRHSGTGSSAVSSVISPQTAAAGPWLCPSPGRAEGGHPSSSGTATQPWASLFSLFFPLPSGKQYLSAYIILASPERPAASAADLSPLLRTVPGGAGGSEHRSRAQGPSGSHAAWPCPWPAPAGNTRPRPHAVPGMGSPCWERCGASHGPPNCSSR